MKPVATRVLVALITGVLAATLAGPAQALRPTAAGASSAGAAPPAAAASRQVSSAARVGRYSPQPGVLFNNPLTKLSPAINRHVRYSIASAPRGSKIRLMTWNFKSDAYVRALRAAHRRGVSVRLLMSHGLAMGQSSTGSYATLKRALATGNRTRPPDMRSWVRTCRNSCRGREGILHSKFFLFSRAGRSRYVVMSTSANLTSVAANNQWNDMMTTVGQEKVYSNFLKIFNQAARDRPQTPSFYSFRDGDVRGWFHPRVGQRHLVLQLLDPVRCRGAAAGSGIRGRTSIRIAQAVFNGKVGYRIARRLKALHRLGCNMKIVYTVMAGKSRATLAGIPSRHIVQDFDGDGSYDRYLHMKAIAISGRSGNDTSAHIVLNGSANWSGMGIQSDEQGFIVRRESTERRYARWVDRVFANPPRSAFRTVPFSKLKDPYSEVEMD